MADKRAILIFGVESSGTRLWTEHCIACGCEGSATHDQPFDKSLEGAGPLIVWRRSFPHFSEMPDIPEMLDRLDAAGYSDVSAFWCRRDLFCTIKSQVHAGHAKTEEEARERTERGLATIGSFIKSTDLPCLIVAYEGLADLDYRTRLLLTFGFTPRRELPTIRDENAKWKMGDSERF